MRFKSFRQVNRKEIFFSWPSKAMETRELRMKRFPKSAREGEAMRSNKRKEGIKRVRKFIG